MYSAFQLTALRWGRVARDGTYKIPANTAIEKDTYHAGSCSTLQNIAGTLQDNPHKISTVCSGDVPAAEKKNPAALAGATGSNSIQYKLPEAYTANPEIATLQLQIALISRRFGTTDHLAAQVAALAFGGAA